MWTIYLYGTTEEASFAAMKGASSEGKKVGREGGKKKAEGEMHG